jgi:hypothetical protein
VRHSVQKCAVQCGVRLAVSAQLASHSTEEALKYAANCSYETAASTGTLIKLVSNNKQLCGVACWIGAVSCSVVLHFVEPASLQAVFSAGLQAHSVLYSPRFCISACVYRPALSGGRGSHQLNCSLAPALLAYPWIGTCLATGLALLQLQQVPCLQLCWAAAACSEAWQQRARLGC